VRLARARIRSTVDVVSIGEVGNRHPNEPLLDEHLAAENQHDLERIMVTYGASPVVVLNGQRIEGQEAIREFHRTFGFSNAGSFSEVHVTEVHRHRAADGIIIEQRLSGRHTGSWRGIEPTGRVFEISVCTVYSFDDRGKLASERVYFDAAWLARQLQRP
jgi:hypothetical protein